MEVYLVLSLDFSQSSIKQFTENRERPSSSKPDMHCKILKAKFLSSHYSLKLKNIVRIIITIIIYTLDPVREILNINRHSCFISGCSIVLVQGAKHTSTSRSVVCLPLMSQ